MKFSLIVPTINRVQELERLFQSLVAQNYADIEVIVVDQNKDNRLLELIYKYRHLMSIVHVRETQKGQSHARNIGFKYVKGDIVAFPDDDCVYTNGLLGKITKFFKTNPEMDGLLTRVFGLDEDKNAFEPCGDGIPEELDYAKTYKIAVSCSIFFRAHISEEIYFDETLGPGAGTPWACGDEADYLFRCIDAGNRFYYDAALIVRHPNPLKNNVFRKQLKREYSYGIGRGYFLATHRLPQPLLKFEYWVPYQDTASLFFKGKWRRAIFMLMKGLGTSYGFRAGRKAISPSNTQHRTKWMAIFE